MCNNGKNRVIGNELNNILPTFANVYSIEKNVYVLHGYKMR